MNKQKQYSKLESYFKTMVVVPGVLLFVHATGPSYGIASTLISGGMVVVGGIGTLVMIALKNLLPKAQDEATDQERVTTFSQIPEDAQIEWSVDNRMTRADYIRCTLYVLRHERSGQIQTLYTPLPISCIIGLPLVPTRPVLAIVIVIGIFAMWIAFLTAFVCKTFLQAYPTTASERSVTTTLTRMGFVDAAPEALTFVPWEQVVRIEEHEGDVYIWQRPDFGYPISRRAFQDTDKARAFFQKATELWKTPLPLPKNFPIPIPEGTSQFDVWPPPPKI